MAITCPGCGSSISEKTEPLRGRSIYRLFACAGCGLHFWEPRGLDRQLYEDGLEGGFGLVMPGHIKVKTLYMWHDQFFRKFRGKGGSLLDIGCGNGSFVDECRKRGFSVYGIDLDRVSVSNARCLGLENIYSVTLKDFVEFAAEKGLRFDVITFFEVLEHQEDAGEFIECVKRVLKPGGYIAGSVPNRDRLILRAREEFDYPPHHFMWWSRASLHGLLERRGFTDIDISTTYRMKYLIAYLNSQVFGWGRNARLSHFLKNRVLRLSADESHATLDSLIYSGKTGAAGRLLLSMKNASLFLPAWLLSSRLQPHLYFQCRKEETPARNS